MAPKNTATAPFIERNGENNAPVTAKDAVDASKLNELMANLDDRLAGGLRGDFFELGSPLDDKNRHGQLEIAFALKKELEKINCHMNKQAQHAESEQGKPGKGAPAANKNMIATVKNIVQQELTDKMRDQSIRIERLEASLKKSEETKQDLVNKLKTLETKLKKAEEGRPTSDKAPDVKGLERRCDKARDDVQKLSKTVIAGDPRVAKLERDHRSILVELSSLRSSVSVEQNVSADLEKRVSNLEEWRDEEEAAAQYDDDGNDDNGDEGDGLYYYSSDDDDFPW